MRENKTIKKQGKISRIEICMCSAQTSKSNYHFHGSSGFYVSEIFVLTSHIQKQLPYSWLLGFLSFKSIPHHFCGNAGYYYHKEGELIGVNDLLNVRIQY